MPCFGLGININNGGVFASAIPMDADALAYITNAGVTDAAAQAAINLFVIGLKLQGLWGNFVSWPMIPKQNPLWFNGNGYLSSLGGYGSYNAVNGAVIANPAISFPNNFGSTGQFPVGQILLPTVNSQGLGLDFTLYQQGISQIDPTADGYPINTGTMQYYNTGLTPPNMSSPIIGSVFKPAWVGNTDSYVISAGSNYINQTSYGSNPSGSFKYSCDQNGGKNQPKRQVYSLGSTAGVMQMFVGNPSFVFNNISGYYPLAGTTIPCPVPICIGGDGTNPSAFGTHAFAFYHNGTWSSSQAANFYNLYKSTLGVGLGLT
jgi:hypothetical protein